MSRAGAAGGNLGPMNVPIGANTEGLEEGFARAIAATNKWAGETSNKLKRAGAEFESSGRRMSLSITAPLAALAIYSARAADKTGEVSKQMQLLSQRGKLAVEPLGRSLLQAFESARPTIERLVNMAGAAVAEFEKLDEGTKRIIIVSLAAAAAIGPLTFGMGSMIRMASTAAMGVKGITTAMVSLAGVLPPVIVGLAAVTAAAAAFELGRYLHDEFRWVQEDGAQTVYLLTTGWEHIKFVALAAFPAIAREWDYQIGRMQLRAAELVQSIADGLRRAPDWLGGGESGAQPLDRFASELQSAAMTRAFNSGLDERLAKLRRSRDEAIDLARQVRDTSLAGIQQDFGSQGRRGRSFLDFLKEDQEGVAGVVGSMTARLRGLLSSVNAWGAAASLSLDTMNVAAANGAEFMKEVVDAWQDASKNAQRLRLELFPEEWLAEQVRQLDQWRAWRPDLLDDEAYQRARDRIDKHFKEMTKKADETFGTKMGNAVEGFSRNVSNAFADLVVDGNASFDELARSFQKMVLSMTLQELALGPIFKVLGQGIGTALGGGGTATPGGANELLHGPPTPTRVGGYVPDRAAHEAMFGGVQVVINDHRQGGAPVEVAEGTGPNGQRLIRVLIRDEMKGAFSDGSMDKTMGANYGVSRRGGRR